MYPPSMYTAMGKMTRWRDYKMTRLQDDEITRWRDCDITRLQDNKMTRFWDAKIMRWRDDEMTRWRDVIRISEFSKNLWE